jgi:hypothetical protein
LMLYRAGHRHINKRPKQGCRQRNPTENPTNLSKARRSCRYCRIIEQWEWVEGKKGCIWKSQKTSVLTTAASRHRRDRISQFARAPA